ncbi:uncharacterized protein [Rutidosis leptorrhynchoides]|uniref:uncharacterized protein n=1 Tax=Rutidosis leptorrhynchoides TaxID=125765 RepID=UPI003A9A3CB8
MSYYLWSLITHKQSLWVKWIHEYRLNSKSVWEVSVQSMDSWGWRKILHIRDIIRRYIIHQIGNGSSCSAWYDTWCDLGPLANIVSYRDINSAGYSTTSKVHDVVDQSGWKWPANWNLKYPILNLIQPPVINNEDDKVNWRDADGNMQQFSVGTV